MRVWAHVDMVKFLRYRFQGCKTRLEFEKPLEKTLEDGWQRLVYWKKSLKTPLTRLPKKTTRTIHFNCFLFSRMHKIYTDFVFIACTLVDLFVKPHNYIWRSINSGFVLPLFGGSLVMMFSQGGWYSVLQPNPKQRLLLKSLLKTTCLQYQLETCECFTLYLEFHRLDARRRNSSAAAFVGSY